MRAQHRIRITRVGLVSFFAGATAALCLVSPPIISAQPSQSAAQATEHPATPATAAPSNTSALPPAAAASEANKAPATSKTGAAAAAAAPSAAAASAAPPIVGPAKSGDDRYVINSDLITLTVTVTDMYGRFVTGLGQKAFSIFDEKDQQEISFFSDEDAPVSLGVIFDVSGSMSGDKISRAREALSRFIETSHQGDEYFLIGFNSRAQLLLDKTRNSDALMDKLTFVATKGQTALYDAAYLGVEKVTRGTHQKRAVLLISDGQDNSSRYTFSELRRLLKETDVIIYAIGIVDGHDDSSLGIGGRAILEELAGVSGGKAFFPSTSAEMNDTFERIALELRTQYSIGYRPTNFANDGKWHKLKVKVQPPRGMSRLFVRSKEGYYAVTNPR